MLTALERAGKFVKKDSRNSGINLLQPNPLSIDRKITYLLFFALLVSAVMLLYLFSLRAEIKKFDAVEPELLLEAGQEEQLRLELEEMSYWLDFYLGKSKLSASCLHQPLLAAAKIIGEDGSLQEIKYLPGELRLSGRTQDIESYNKIIQRQAGWRSQGLEVFLERKSYSASPDFKLILLEVNQTGAN